jgi:hypothetical protein
MVARTVQRHKEDAPHHPLSVLTDTKGIHTPLCPSS